MSVGLFVRGSILAYPFLLAVLTDETSSVIGSHDRASIDLCHGPVRSRTAIQLSVRAPGETGQLSAGKITEEEWGEYCQRRVRAFPHRRWPREQNPKESPLDQTRQRSNLPLALRAPLPPPLSRSFSTLMLVRRHAGSLFGRRRRAGAADLEGKAGRLGEHGRRENGRAGAVREPHSRKGQASKGRGRPVCGVESCRGASRRGRQEKISPRLDLKARGSLLTRFQ